MCRVVNENTLGSREARKKTEKHKIRTRLENMDPVSHNKAESNKEEMKDVFKKKTANSYQLKILGGYCGRKKEKIQETG